MHTNVHQCYTWIWAWPNEETDHNAVCSYLRCCYMTVDDGASAWQWRMTMTYAYPQNWAVFFVTDARSILQGKNSASFFVATASHAGTLSELTQIVTYESKSVQRKNSFGIQLMGAACNNVCMCTWIYTSTECKCTCAHVHLNCISTVCMRAC